MRPRDDPHYVIPAQAGQIRQERIWVHKVQSTGLNLRMRIIYPGFIAPLQANTIQTGLWQTASILKPLGSSTNAP
jgi:hypothetical protein